MNRRMRLPSRDRLLELSGSGRHVSNQDSQGASVMVDTNVEQVVAVCNGKCVLIAVLVDKSDLALFTGPWRGDMTVGKEG